MTFSSFPERLWIDIVYATDFLEPANSSAAHDVVDMSLVHCCNAHCFEGFHCGFDLGLVSRWVDQNAITVEERDIVFCHLLSIVNIVYEGYDSVALPDHHS